MRPVARGAVYARVSGRHVLACAAAGRQLAQNVLRHCIDPLAVRLYHDIGNLAVQGCADFHQLAEPAVGFVAVSEQRPCASMADALSLLGHRSLQIDDAAARCEPAAVLRHQYRAAPGRQNDALECRERLDRLALTLTKSRLALLV